VDSEPAVTRMTRAAVVLIVAGAVIFMLGVLAALAGAALRLTAGHHRAAPVTPWSVGSAENIAVLGLAIGLGALVLVLPAVAVSGRVRGLVRALVRGPRRRAPLNPLPGEPDQDPVAGQLDEAGRPQFLMINEYLAPSVAGQEGEPEFQPPSLR
jgi:hypothetical protein